MRGEKRQAKLVEINNSMIQAVSNPTQKLFCPPLSFQLRSPVPSKQGRSDRSSHESHPSLDFPERKNGL